MNLNRCIIFFFLILTSTSYAIPYNLSYGDDISTLGPNWVKYYNSQSFYSHKGMSKYCHRIGTSEPEFYIGIPSQLPYSVPEMYSEYLTSESGREMYLSGRNHPMSSPFKTDIGKFIITELFKSQEFKDYLSLVEMYKNKSQVLKQVVYKHRDKYKCIGFISNKIFHVSVTSKGLDSRFPVILNNVTKKYKILNNNTYQIKYPEEWKNISFERARCKDGRSCYVRELQLESPTQGEIIHASYLADNKDISFFKDYKTKHVENMYISYTNKSMFDSRENTIAEFEGEFKDAILPKIHKKMIDIFHSYESKSNNEESTF